MTTSHHKCCRSQYTKDTRSSDHSVLASKQHQKEQPHQPHVVAADGKQVAQANGSKSLPNFWRDRMPVACEDAEKEAIGIAPCSTIDP
jgi:hypothetical protein